jgi:glutathione S-transferase
MITLYGFGQSRSFRAAWALEEAGLEYNYIAVDFNSDQSPHGRHSDDYKAINFQGKVPTLQDEDLTLTESAAILNYIARKAPASGLMPGGDIKLLARYDELAYFVLSDLEQPLWSHGKHRFALPEEQRVPQMLNTANWEFAKSLRALDNHIGDSEFALGDQFTNLDILIAQTINWAQRFKFDVPEKYAAIRNRHYERPAAIKAMEVTA